LHFKETAIRLVGYISVGIHTDGERRSAAAVMLIVFLRPVNAGGLLDVLLSEC